MKVLVACEESQRVCIAFRKRGHEAYSCDIQEPSGGHPEWHILGDALKAVEGSKITTMDGKTHDVGRWDLLIAHPPCTYLTVSGNRYFNVDKYGNKAKDRLIARQEAARFFLAFATADVPRIAVENPVGVMSTLFRKPDQIIQPYQFGHPVRKSTCLWLYNLPKLKPTNIVDFECIHSNGKSGGYSGPSWVVKDENGKILSYNDPRVKKIRSVTYIGIAEAMAEQWGGDIR